MKFVWERMATHIVEIETSSESVVVVSAHLTPTEAFMSEHTAPHMRWHAESRTQDGVLRHLADGEAWKSFDQLHLDFSADSRNVMLGLTSDGFNPFGNMSTSHSTWPVMLVPYNLSPWI
jgi:hypothetical protein